ncbi:hypothetical protein [Xanthomonas phaseoli]|uniref:hypothetical protein n=1 Tax=Xanthomonas phaseoli TaxID=1985254 RepID=UPI001EE63E4C|nr:hypothetical protein [Xanthomonas phaseoli]
MKDEGVSVPMTKLCHWFGVARRTTYYKPTRSPAKVKPELAEPIKKMIETEPSFGYRTVAALLGMNKNTVQRIFQLKGWQVRKRALGQRPRIEAKVSRAEKPDQRWATDLCRVWGGKDGWLSLALVIAAARGNCSAGTCHGPVKPARHLPHWSRRSSRATARWAGCRSHFCFARTMVWCSPAATTPDWCAAMG